MTAIKGVEKYKIQTQAKAAEPPRVPPPQNLLDPKILSGVLELMAKNLERLGNQTPRTEINVTAPPIREYVIKHSHDSSGRITESIISVKSAKSKE